MVKGKEIKKVAEQDANLEYVPKSVRQAAFLESCKGLTVEEAVQKAKLFQNVNREDFEIIHMTG